MRNQFVADVSDLRKLAFLRSIVPDGSALGVAWYYVDDPDGSEDGKHREYKDEPKWQALDAPLHNHLKAMREHSVAALEALPVWPNGTEFHRNELVPTACPQRDAWASTMLKRFKDCDIVFADPDKGLGPASAQHATQDEIELLGLKGKRPVAFIKFPGRENHEEQVAKLHAQFAPAGMVTVRTCIIIKKTPRIVWLSVLHPSDAIRAAVRDFADRFNSVDDAEAIIH